MCSPLPTGLSPAERDEYARAALYELTGIVPPPSWPRRLSAAQHVHPTPPKENTAMKTPIFAALLALSGITAPAFAAETARCLPLSEVSAPAFAAGWTIDVILTADGAGAFLGLYNAVPPATAYPADEVVIFSHPEAPFAIIVLMVDGCAVDGLRESPALVADILARLRPAGS